MLAESQVLYKIAGKIGPDLAEQFYQDYLAQSEDANAEIRRLEEIFGL